MRPYTLHTLVAGTPSDLVAVDSKKDGPVGVREISFSGFSSRRSLHVCSRGHECRRHHQTYQEREGEDAACCSKYITPRRIYVYRFFQSACCISFASAVAAFVLRLVGLVSFCRSRMGTGS